MNKIVASAIVALGLGLSVGVAGTIAEIANTVDMPNSRVVSIEERHNIKTYCIVHLEGNSTPITFSQEDCRNIRQGDAVYASLKPAHANPVTDFIGLDNESIGYSIRRL